MLMDVEYFEDIEGKKNKDRKNKMFSVKRSYPIDIKEAEPGELLALKMNHVEDNHIVIQEYRLIDGKMMTPLTLKNKGFLKTKLLEDVEKNTYLKDKFCDKIIHVNKGWHLKKDSNPICLFSKSSKEFYDEVEDDEIKYIEQSNKQYKTNLINKYSEHLRSVNGFLWIETLGPFMSLSKSKPHYISNVSKTPEMMSYELDTEYKAGLPVSMMGAIKKEDSFKENSFYEEIYILNPEKFNSFSEKHYVQLLFNNVFGLNIKEELQSNTGCNVSYDDYMTYLFNNEAVGGEIEFYYKNFQQDQTLDNLKSLLLFMLKNYPSFNKETNAFKVGNGKYKEYFKSDFDMFENLKFTLNSLNNLDNKYNLVLYDYDGYYLSNTNEPVLKIGM